MSEEQYQSSFCHSYSMEPNKGNNVYTLHKDGNPAMCVNQVQLGVAQTGAISGPNGSAVGMAAYVCNSRCPKCNIQQTFLQNPDGTVKDVSFFVSISCQGFQEIFPIPNPFENAKSEGQRHQSPILTLTI